MIRDLSPVTQALLGTIFTWFVTAAGSSLVFVFNRAQRKVLDGSLGFAAGVMTAASFWSLLAPAIEMAESSGSYGANGEFSFLPVAFGFLIGALFVYGTDYLLPLLGIANSANIALALQTGPKIDKDGLNSSEINPVTRNSILELAQNNYSHSGPLPYKRPFVNENDNAMPIQINSNEENVKNSSSNSNISKVSWRRIMLLIIAITVHNIPEGLAVGVGFGAVNKSGSATFENARNLAIGIGIQNFPEGLAVSLPLRGAGFSVWRSFWYGQLSGMVEPIAGLIGALAVTIAEPILPYAMAFAAGAMIYVVFDDILPEAQTCGNGKLCSWSAIFGFIVMMSLDVGLG